MLVSYYAGAEAGCHLGELHLQYGEVVICRKGFFCLKEACDLIRWIGLSVMCQSGGFSHGGL